MVKFRPKHNPFVGAAMQSSHSDVLKNLTIEKIQQEGDCLGGGTYGTAYRYQGLVYKIYHKTRLSDLYTVPARDIPDGLALQQVHSAQRSKFYWNKIYKNIYGGKYKKLASAEVITINNIDVLVTPFIDGDSAYLGDSAKKEARKQFAEELKKLDVGMRDDYIADNVKINSALDLLPVDFDAFYRLPTCIGRINPSDPYPSYAYFADEEPPSPGSRLWTKGYYYNLLHNYPRPVSQPDSATLESKKEELPATVSLVAEAKAPQPSEENSLEKRRGEAIAIINSYRSQNVWFKWFGKKRAGELAGELQNCQTTDALNTRVKEFMQDGKTASDRKCVWKFFSWTQSSRTSETSLRRMFQSNFKMR